jgi:hypothetical protein
MSTTQLESVELLKENTAKVVEAEASQPEALENQQEAIEDTAAENLVEDAKQDEESKEDAKKKSSNRTRNKRKKKTALPALNLGSDAFVPNIVISVDPVAEPKPTKKAEEVAAESSAAPEKRKRAKKTVKVDDPKE